MGLCFFSPAPSTAPEKSFPRNVCTVIDLAFTGGNNKPMEKNITYIETRGTLCYMTSDYAPKWVEGWFMLSLDGQTVIRRKIRGRNRYRFASIVDVLSFSPHEEEA